MAESEEKLKSLLMKVKEENEKAGFKLNIQKTKITASGPITSWQRDGETMETVTDFLFLGSKITADDDCRHEIKSCLLLGRKAMTNLVLVLVAQSCPTVWDSMDCNFSARSDYTDLCQQSDASAFNMLSRCVIAFLPGSKHLLISWLQSQSAVILEPKKRKSATTSTFSPSVCHEVDAMILVFWMLSFKPAFPLPSFTFIKNLFSSS